MNHLIFFYELIKSNYEIIKYCIELISIIFSALIGALIGYILSEGIDPLKDWFDKDIIEKYIINVIDKDFAAFVDDTKAGEDYFMYNCKKSKEEDKKELGLTVYKHCWDTVIKKDLGIFENTTKDRNRNENSDNGASNANNKYTRISLKLLLQFRQPKYNNEKPFYNHIDAEFSATFHPANNDFGYLRDFLTKFQKVIENYKKGFNNISDVKGDLLDELTDDFFKDKTTDKVFSFKVQDLIPKRPLNANKDDLDRIEKEIKDMFYKQIGPVITFIKEYEVKKNSFDTSTKEKMLNKLEEISKGSVLKKNIEMNKLDDNQYAKPTYFVNCSWEKKYARINLAFLKMGLDFEISDKGAIKNIVIRQYMDSEQYRNLLFDLLSDDPLGLGDDKKIEIVEDKCRYKVKYSIDKEFYNYIGFENELIYYLEKAVNNLDSKLNY